MSGGDERQQDSKQQCYFHMVYDTKDSVLDVTLGYLKVCLYSKTSVIRSEGFSLTLSRHMEVHCHFTEGRLRPIQGID